MQLRRLPVNFRHFFEKLNGRQIGLLFLISSSLTLAAVDLDRFLTLASQRYGSAGNESAQAWRHLLANLAHQSESVKIRQVNEFFNRRVQFDDDINIWGVKDYWATPLEVLGGARGDCEDYAVAKYVTLKLLGISIEKLRLTYVKALIGGSQGGVTQAHMVLSYYPAPDDEPLVLDNLISDVRPASRRPDLFPVFSFNSEGLWVGGVRSKETHSTERLSRWRNLILRMREEGIE